MTALREPSASEVRERASLLTDSRITDAVLAAARQQLAAEPAPEPPAPTGYWLRESAQGEIEAAERRLGQIVEELDRVMANVGDALGSRVQTIRGLVEMARFDAETLAGDLGQGAYAGSLAKPGGGR